MDRISEELALATLRIYKLSLTGEDDLIRLSGPATMLFDWQYIYIYIRIEAWFVILLVID